MTINWEVIIWTCITLAVLMSIIGLILYAISAKNVRSKRKELGEVHTELKVGSRIMFAGGVYGKVVSIDDEDTLRVDGGPQGRHHHLPLRSPEPAEIRRHSSIFAAFAFLS